jgi:predicted nucleic acid-binding Zn ribbon protein
MKNKCMSCGKETDNKEFCSGKCRKMFNSYMKECNDTPRNKRTSTRGLRA